MHLSSNERICDKTSELNAIPDTELGGLVHLACAGIRHCSSGSIQIARLRMRSVLSHQTLPVHHHSRYASN